MFCTNCGQQLEDDAKFCPNCGMKVEKEEPVSKVDEVTAPVAITAPQAEEKKSAKGNASKEKTQEAEGEKINWKEYCTNDKIERFAPIAAFLPLAMSIVSFVLGLLLGVFILLPLGAVVFGIITLLIKILFMVASVAATAGLIKVALEEKDTSKITTWIAPAVVGVAAVASILGVFGLGIVAGILGLITAVFGIEFLARIVIGNKPMDSSIDPAGAVNTYKEFYADYKQKYPTTSELEKAGIEDPENSKFDGAGLQLLGYYVLSAIVCTITCGIAAPWMICKIYNWKIKHTIINGKRLTFTGNGASLLGHWILWEILTVITCGIYSYFLHVQLRKWELRHTFIEGEPVIAGQQVSEFDGGSMAYLGYGILATILTCITCFLGYPWVMAMLQKWDTKHQIINGRRLKFSGSGLGFLGEFLIILLLSVITCSIYTPWGVVRMNKYIIRNTDFVD